MEAVLAAIVTAFGAVVVAKISNRGVTKKVDGMGEKVNEAHRMLTVNHHTSRTQGKPDTVLDHLADLKDLVEAHGGLLAEHVRHSEYRDAANDRRFERIEEALDVRK